MSTAYSQIFELSVPDRLRLFEELWESIARAPKSLPLIEWQKAELNRRKAAQDQSGTPGASWEEVEQRIRERHA